MATNFLGGPAATPALNAPSVKNSVVTLTWSATEGGTYLVESTTNFSGWTTNATSVAAVLDAASYTNLPTDRYRFYSVARTALATYDSAGTGGGTVVVAGATYNVPGNSQISRGIGTNITLNITLPGTPPSPPTTDAISSVTLGSLAATSTSYPSKGNVLASFTIPSTATTGELTAVVTFSQGPPPFTFSDAVDLVP